MTKQEWIWMDEITPCDAETPHCNWCERPMTEEDHDFCDICDECREENDLLL